MQRQDVPEITLKSAMSQVVHVVDVPVQVRHERLHDWQM